MVRTYQYPLHPTPEQAETMLRWFDGCRWLWNQAVEHHRLRCRAGGKYESFQAMSAAIPPARMIPDSPLADVPGTWAQGTLRQLEDGWQLHWSKLKSGKKTRPPQFRSRVRSQSVRFAVQNGSKPGTPDFLVRATDTGSLRFSQVRIVKLGWVVARIDRPLPPDAICGSMVVRLDELGRWWVQFQCEVPPVEHEPTGQVVGVDRGIAHSFVTDDGRCFDTPGMTPGEARRHLKLNRSLSRTRRMNPCPADRWAGKKLIRGHCECEAGGCWRSSGRYAESRRKLAKLKAREARRREDAAHKVSAVLAAENDVVVFEELDVHRMARSAKGTLEKPGRNVAAKSGLNRSIAQQAWGSTKNKTAYKTKVVTVSARHTSQTCAECGHVDSASRPSQAVFICTACGRVDNADRNAARNIRQRGIDLLTSEQSGPAATQAVAGRGGDRVERPDEPPTLTTLPFAPLVPDHWGFSRHRAECRPRARRRTRRAAKGRHRRACVEREAGIFSRAIPISGLA